MDIGDLIQKLVTIESYMENCDSDMALFKCENLREELLIEQASQTKREKLR